MAQGREVGHRGGPSPTAEDVMPELKHETHVELGEGLLGRNTVGKLGGWRDHHRSHHQHCGFAGAEDR